MGDGWQENGLIFCTARAHSSTRRTYASGSLPRSYSVLGSRL